MIDKFDLINGLFEFGGGLFNILNIRRIYKDKVVRGVSIVPTFFFSLWGIFNLFFYPHLNQWLSFTGGLFVMLSNLVWVVMALHYTYGDRFSDWIWSWFYKPIAERNFELKLKETKKKEKDKDK